jgi:hypothetical protein
MQPTPIKYYVFHFKVKKVHYKDRSPNDAKLADVTFNHMIKWENVEK